jgi:hypothetical protein
MEISNLHQPFVYNFNGNINLIVSEISDKKFEFKFGEDFAVEDYWKLYHLDENYNKTEIKTPKTININNLPHFVIQECNGFISGNRLSYIAGVHRNLDGFPMGFILVSCEFNHQTKEVGDIMIHRPTRTGYIDSHDEFWIDKKSGIIYKNGILLFNTSLLIFSPVRLIGVFDNKQKILFTGVKDNELVTFLFDTSNNKKYLLKSDGKNVYKSSIYGNSNDGIIVYTDKIFSGNLQADYLLNIKYGYELIEI